MSGLHYFEVHFAAQADQVLTDEGQHFDGSGDPPARLVERGQGGIRRRELADRDELNDVRDDHLQTFRLQAGSGKRKRTG